MSTWRIIFILPLLCFALILSSCSKKPTYENICSPQGQQWLEKTVGQLGGQYVEYGQQVLFELPTQVVFIGHSRNYTKKGRWIMGKVADRLACYATIATYSTVYTGTLPSRRANVVLAKQRSSVIGATLLQHNVKRLISENGQATTEPSLVCGINRVKITTKQYNLEQQQEPKAPSCQR